jgi:hypothetical protein
MQPLDAFQIIYKDINNAFDYDIVKAFYAKLEFFPANTIVELSDNRIGIVIQGGGGNFKLRPTVRVWGSDEILELTAPRNCSIHIARVLNPSDLPAGFEFL